MFEAQQRFRFAVAVLLFDKSTQRESPIMPNDRSRTERDYPTSLLNSPAEIHVVASLAIFGIESAYTFEGPPVKCHVTTGNVLSDGTGTTTLVWSAGRGSKARLNPIWCWRRNFWSADAAVIATAKRANQVIQPIAVAMQSESV